MQIVNFKLQESILKEVDGCLEQFHFNNRTEFIRDAIREKLENLRKERALYLLKKYRGSIKRNITDEEIERIKAEAFQELKSELR